MMDYRELITLKSSIPILQYQYWHLYMQYIAVLQAGILEMLSNITITNLHYRSLQVCFEAARQSLSSSQILWQQQLGFSRPAAGWIHPAARDYISAAPTSPVASHFLLRPIRGDLRPTRGDLSNERGFHQIVGTRESWSSRRQQTKQHFFLLQGSQSREISDDVL